MKTMQKKMTKLVIAAAVAMLSVGSFAAVSADEAAKLKSELTPLGAERAGNKEGTIPAWTGGLSNPNHKGDSRADIFAADKPLYVITAANVAQYANVLSDGQKEMFKKYPDYKMEVYTTRRTAAYPQWVQDNTFKNATRAKLTSGGNAFEGAYGGAPFPIPKNGHEAMWNHILRWSGEAGILDAEIWLVTGGKPVMTTSIRNEVNTPYYFKEGSVETFKGEHWMTYQNTIAPPYKAGEVIVARDAISAETPRQAWQYLTGQRRIRKAPSIGYDTPNFVTSGFDFFDEVQLFIGGLDRFDWKLSGKKEMLIPYNNNNFISRKTADVLGPNYANHIRWELHRTWVVDATVAAGKRQLMPKRRFYLDEDTWSAALYDGWDAQGQLWRTGLMILASDPSIPAQTGLLYSINDLIKGGYEANIGNGTKYNWTVQQRFPDSNFTPENAAARSIR